PLILPMREAAFEMGLKGPGTAAHIPGTIVKLRAEQEANSLLKDRLENPDSAYFVQGNQGLSRGPGIATQPIQLRPAAVGLLFCKDRGDVRLKLLSAFSRPAKAQKLKDLLIERVRPGLFEILAPARDPACELTFAAGQRIKLQRMNGKSCSLDRPIFHRRTIIPGLPGTVRLLHPRDVPNHRLRQLIGRVS